MPWRLGGTYFGLGVLFEMAQYLESAVPGPSVPSFPFLSHWGYCGFAVWHRLSIRSGYTSFCLSESCCLISGPMNGPP